MVELMQGDGASQGTGVQSFTHMLDSAFAEASKGAEQPVAPEQVQTEPAPKAEEKPVENADVIEFEGKQYRIEKSAKDYLQEALHAKKGMRKAFSERDNEKKRWKERETDLSRYDQITDTFKKKGIEGLYDALAGKDGAYNDHLKKREELAIRKYNATEDELKLIQQEEMIERERALRELAEKTQKEVLENIQRKETEAQKAILSTRLNEAFEQVSFEGKLGAAPEEKRREEKFNRYIWEQARMQLKEYADAKGIAHHEIPVKVIRSTFTDIASDFTGIIKKEVDSKVKDQVQVASDAATLAAQSRSTNEGKKSSGKLEDLADEHKGNAHNFINAIFKRK